MASGVPVVGARAGGIPSIIQDGLTGFLANPRDPTDFASKVYSLKSSCHISNCCCNMCALFQINKLLESRRMLKEMGTASSEEMEKHSWESATSHLRNVLYVQARTNFDTKYGKRNQTTKSS